MLHSRSPVRLIRTRVLPLSLLTVIATPLAIALLLTQPASASACTGCPVSLREVVHDASSLFLATSDGQIGDRSYRLAVTQSLTGAVPPAVTYRAIPGEPDMPAGSRWIIVIYPVDQVALQTGQLDGRWDEAWPVIADGHITLPGMVAAPDTLSSLLAWFGLPATDTDGPSAGSGPSPTSALLLVVSAGAFLPIDTWLRRRARRERSTPAER
jgi:hypothetical protein